MEHHMQQDTFSHYDRRVKPERITVRPMTLAEYHSLRYGQQCECWLADGRIADCRISSSVKRWKRKPEAFRVSLKYGLYECWQIEHDGTNDYESRHLGRFVPGALVVRVNGGEHA